MVNRETINDRFKLACKKHGLNEGRTLRQGLTCDLFAPPPRAGDQLRLL